MHELGIVFEVVKIVDAFSKENNLTVVDKIVLEVGELSQALPRFLEECYPAAVCDTPYENTKLDIITVPAQGYCKHCEEIFNIIKYNKVCPNCQESDFKILSGEEFSIKEVVAY